MAGAADHGVQHLLHPRVLVYGLSSVFIAILNTRNVFGPPAWAPAVNNRHRDLAVYLAVRRASVDPVRMGNQAAGARHQLRRVY